MNKKVVDICMAKDLSHWHANNQLNTYAISQSKPSEVEYTQVMFQERKEKRVLIEQSILLPK